MKSSEWLNSQKIDVFVPGMIWSSFGVHTDPDWE